MTKEQWTWVISLVESEFIMKENLGCNLGITPPQEYLNDKQTIMDELNRLKESANG